MGIPQTGLPTWAALTLILQGFSVTATTIGFGAVALTILGFKLNKPSVAGELLFLQLTPGSYSILPLRDGNILSKKRPTSCGTFALQYKGRVKPLAIEFFEFTGQQHHEPDQDSYSDCESKYS